MISPPLKRHVLLAEDNPGDVLLVRRALDFHCVDCELTIAGNGEAALEQISRADAGEIGMDLIVADLNLPRVDGGQIVSAVRSSTRLQNVPVILMTSSDSPAEKVRLLELGATVYFRKPTDLDSFMEIGSLIKELASCGKRRQRSSVTWNMVPRKALGDS